MLQDLIEGWCDEYGTDASRIMTQYSNLGQHLMGLTTFKHNEKGECTALIDVHTCLEDHPLAVKAVAWHEYCHAEAWVADGQTEGHGDKWNSRRWRKPVLVILDIFYAKVLFAFIGGRK